MPRLILASTSPYRRELLSRLGWEFETQAPSFDEEAAKAQAGTDFSAHAAFLARGKAQSLLAPRKLNSAAAQSDDVVIGGDQLIAFAGQILGKPKTFSKAVEQLQSMAGQTHELHTAVCVLLKDQVCEWVHVTRMTMRPLSRGQIEEYVRRDHPLDCAGSYKFEKQGLLLFEKIECDDFTAIQGLPLIQLAQVLIDFGFEPFIGKGST